MNPNIIYQHYGSTKFEHAIFRYVQNIPYFSKPAGGFWASQKDASFGWKQWNESEEFVECLEENSFCFRLRENAVVKQIKEVSQLKQLPSMKYPYEPDPFDTVYLDFEEIYARGIDAIELCYYGKEYKPSDLEPYRGDLYYALYGWDCDSILIMNPDIIIPL